MATTAVRSSTMFMRLKKPSIPENKEALPWLVVFLLLFLCMSACSSLLNLIDRLKGETRDDPQVLVPISPWLAAKQRKEQTTVTSFPVEIGSETVRPLSFAYSGAEETRYQKK